MKKRIKNKLFAIFWIILLITITFTFVKGFAELVQNQSTYVTMFYGIITIFFVLQLSDWLKSPLDTLFNQQKLKDLEMK